MKDLQSLTRDEILEKIEEKLTWTEAEVRVMLSSMRGGMFQLPKPTETRIGDIYYNTRFKHPCIVIGIKENIVYSLMITSKEECLGVLEQCQSRFFSDSFITSALLTVDLSIVKDNFLAVYENLEHLNKIKKLLRKSIKKL